MPPEFPMLQQAECTGLLFLWKLLETSFYKTKSWLSLSAPNVPLFQKIHLTLQHLLFRERGNFLLLFILCCNLLILVTELYHIVRILLRGNIEKFQCDDVMLFYHRRPEAVVRSPVIFFALCHNKN